MRVKKINEEEIIKIKKSKKKVIYVFWHGRQFLLVPTHRFRNIYIMASLSRDGDLQVSGMSKFGYKFVRGSTGKKGAVQGTLEIVKKISEGYDAAFAADGPHGPGFSVKPGVLFIAQKTKSIIIPTTCSAKYRKIFKNWDRYLLPLPIPFNYGIVYYGKPMEVKEDDNLELKSVELEKELNRITILADNIVYNNTVVT
jgi:lysophospholipid acyltransferase (LPLAT)-like uncharacterized protein